MIIPKEEAFHNGLPKWPQMKVIGKPVSEELAREIILRTDNFFGYSGGGNNHAFNKKARELFGIKERPNGMEEFDDWSESIENFLKAVGHIDTQYVENDWISCCFIYGPHGWMHPDGTIGFADNVGKWPSVEEVYEDWEKIAKEYPQLDLKVTLFSCEECEDCKYPVVTMEIKDGKIEFTDQHITDDEKIPVCRKGDLTEDQLLQEIFTHCSATRENWYTIGELKEKFVPLFEKLKEKNLKE